MRRFPLARIREALGMSEFFGGRSGGGLAGGLSGPVKMAAIALLVHQLMKHARSQQGAAPASPAPADEGGGLGGLLGSIFGGGSSAAPPAGRTMPTGAPGPAPAHTSTSGPFGGVVDAAGGILGGLGGLLGGLRSQGLGQQVDSWVQPGPNQPVAPQELERSFDPQELDEAARRAGTDRGTLLQELSAMLPQAVDRMTPQGRVPQREEELGSGGLGGLLGSLFGGEPGRPAGQAPGQSPGPWGR